MLEEGLMLRRCLTLEEGLMLGKGLMLGEGLILESGLMLGVRSDDGGQPAPRCAWS